MLRDIDQPGKNGQIPTLVMQGPGEPAYPLGSHLPTGRHEDEIGIELDRAAQHGLTVIRPLRRGAIDREPGRQGQRRVRGTVPDEAAADDDVLVVGAVCQLGEHHIDGARLPDDQDTAQPLRLSAYGQQIPVHELAPDHGHHQAGQQREYPDLGRDLDARGKARDREHAHRGQPVPEDGQYRTAVSHRALDVTILCCCYGEPGGAGQCRGEQRVRLPGRGAEHPDRYRGAQHVHEQSKLEKSP